MAHQYHYADAHMGHSRTIVLTVIAVGFVVMTAVASGLIFGVNSFMKQRPVSSQTKVDSSTQQTASETPSTADLNTNEAKNVTPEPDPSTSDASTDTSSTTPVNNNSVSTTVTVNGESVSVNGPGSVKKSYTSSDGRSKVNISIKHTLSDLHDR